MRKIAYGAFRRDDKGAALVEFSLVAPFLLLLAAGLSEFGMMLHQQQILTKSVRDAARFAARTSAAVKSCPISTQTEWTTVSADAKRLAVYGNIAGTGNPILPALNNVSLVTLSDSCVTPATGWVSPAGAGNNIPVVTVSASVTYAGVGFLGFLGITAPTLTATHSEMWAGL